MARAIMWTAGGAAIAVAAAWLLTSGSGQAKVTAHLSAAASSGDMPLPGQQPPVRTGVTLGAWGPYRHASEGRHRGRAHPLAASPNLTLLQSRGWDWLFCPPSEGDL